MKRLFLLVLIVLLVCAGCVFIPVPVSSETASNGNAPALPSTKPTPVPAPNDPSGALPDDSKEQAVADPPQTNPPVTDDPALPEQYRAEWTDIIRTTKSGEYKVFEFNDWQDGWVYSIEEYIVEPDGVYIMIYGYEKDGDDTDSAYYLYGIKPDGTGRNKLKEINGYSGYTQILPFNDWLIIVEDGGDSMVISYAAKNGTQTGYLDFTDAAAQAGVSPEYNSVELFFDNGLLYGIISFFTDEEPYVALYNMQIREDLEVVLWEID